METARDGRIESVDQYRYKWDPITGSTSLPFRSVKEDAGRSDTFGAKKAKIFTLPEHVGEDWRELFSYPAIVAAWDKEKRFHDRKFVTLIEGYRRV